MRHSITLSQNLLAQQLPNPELSHCSKALALEPCPLRKILKTVDTLIQDPLSLFEGNKEGHQRLSLDPEQQLGDDHCPGVRERIGCGTEIRNVVENKSSEQKLKYKTSIEDRIIDADCDLVPENGSCEESEPRIPDQNWRIDDMSLIEISNNGSITEEHIRKLFANSDSHTIALALGHFSKILEAQTCSLQLPSHLQVLCLSYVFALRVDFRYLDESLVDSVSESFGLDPEAMKTLGDQVQRQAGFDQEINSETLRRIAEFLM